MLINYKADSKQKRAEGTKAVSPEVEAQAAKLSGLVRKSALSRAAQVNIGHFKGPDGST